MGNSCLEYFGEYKFVPDFEIEVVANAILNYTSDNDIELNCVEEWRETLAQPMNGAIDLQLDKFFPEKPDGMNLVDLIEEAKSNFITSSLVTVEEFNEILPYTLKMSDHGVKSDVVSSYFEKIIDFLVGTLAKLPN